VAVSDHDATHISGPIAHHIPGRNSEQSVVKLNIGDRIRLTAEDFERPSAAFFDDLEREFL